ncbi:MAG: PBP1A family penicillin-binding protein [Actinomycetota bacterium]|nr:PBP1A family penicillin-binding protein [Actinomycetota bacterium]
MLSWRHGVRRWAAVVAAAMIASACGEVVTLEPPRIDDALRRPPEQSHVYDAAGNHLAVLRTEFRERVTLDRIPDVLRDAVVVAEDKRFWVHAGVDARAVARAALHNVGEGEVEQGGSTITQQLVKNLYLPDAPRNIRTKAREALLARDLERKWSKDRILEEYLNTVYFGNGAFGVQAATSTYWRKDVSEVTLPEAALLAAVIRAPETLNPSEAPEAATARRDRVLRAMREEGLIGADDIEAALSTPVQVQPRPASPATVQPYWVDFVVRTLRREPTFGSSEAERAALLYGGGLRIHTTLDPVMQAEAEASTRRFFADAGDPEVALVAIEPDTGAIRASVGGRDYHTSQFDLATLGRRQPGSTFKVFVLVAALTAGYRPTTIVNGDQGVFRINEGPTDQDRWPVRNYDRVDYGPITLDQATRSSVNAAYARIALDIGIGRVVAAARALGVTSPLGTNPAIALGGTEVGVSPLEMAASYATLANLGMRVPASPIDRVEDANGNVIWRPDRTPRRVIDPGVAWLATQMLRAVVEDGTGVRARLPGWEVAGKTGTTSRYTDAWFVGYTAELATAVWMGYPNEPSRRPLRHIDGEAVVTGGSWPARIWRAFMEQALAGMTPTGFVLPDEYQVVVEIDPETGLRAAPWCPGEIRKMPRILVPTGTCPSPPPPPPPPPAPTGSEPGAPPDGGETTGSDSPQATQSPSQGSTAPAVGESTPPPAGGTTQPAAGATTQSPAGDTTQTPTAGSAESPSAGSSSPAGVSATSGTQTPSPGSTTGSPSPAPTGSA